MEPRTGKSKVALDYVGLLSLKGETRRVLILAPRIAVNVWRREIRKHFPFAYTVETFEGKWRSPQGGEPRVRFFLASREEVWRATRSPKGKLLRPKSLQLQRWRPDAVVIDESHQYQRPGGRGAQDAWRFVRRLRANGDGVRPYVLLLSGTPNPRGWRSLFAQFRIMDETVFGTSVARFDDSHVVYGHGKRRFTILRYRNEKTILTKVRKNSITVSAREAGLAGKRHWQPLMVTLPAAAMTAYYDMAENMMLEVEGGLITAKNMGVLRLRLLQITGGFTTDGKCIHDSKLQATRDWMALLHQQGEPFVVGARFLPEVDAIAQSVPRGCRVGVVKGETRRDRDRMVSQFQRGRLDSLVFQVQAGAAAIELSRAAEVVMYSLPDGWVEFKQFMDRVMGPNQKRPVRNTAILAKGTLDRSVIRGLIKKEDWHNTLMDNPEAFLQGLL